MTAARQILPGSTYLVTRRCSERRFFLRPSKTITAIFGYLLAVAARRCEIQVHAYCVLSNHVHLVVTDSHARLPEFHRYLDGLVARAVNRALGRWESFWDPDSYSAVRLETADDVFEKMVYVLVNPVAAGLVRRARDWPGLWSDPNGLATASVAFERPGIFFREDGLMPSSASIELRRPPGFEEDEGFNERLRSSLQAAEDRIAVHMREAGRSFLGSTAARAQRPNAHPATVAPRRKLNPQVAAGSTPRRIAALRRLAQFRSDYQEALRAWRAGLRDVLFPAGTWQMRVLHAAACSDPP